MTDDASLDDFLDSDDDGESPSSEGDAEGGPSSDAPSGDDGETAPSSDAPSADSTASADGTAADDTDSAPPAAGSAASDDATTAAADTAVEDPDASGVEPIAATYDWSPDGATCDACGASVDRRWRDGDATVCADCKEW